MHRNQSIGDPHTLMARMPSARRQSGMQGSEYWLALEQRWPRLRTGSILAFSGKTGDARSRPTCGRERLGYETILYAEDGPIGTITLNRPDDGNMFTPAHVSRGARLHQRHPPRDAHARDRAHRGGRKVLLHRRTQGGHGGHDPLRRHAADAGDVRGDREAAEAGDRLGQRLRGRRRQRAADAVRLHHRQGERGVPAGRADDGLVRCRLRHLVPGGPGRQEAGEGDLVPQSQDQRAARRSPWG